MIRYSEAAERPWSFSEAQSFSNGQRALFDISVEAWIQNDKLGGSDLRSGLLIGEGFEGDCLNAHDCAESCSLRYSAGVKD